MVYYRVADVDTSPLVTVSSDAQIRDVLEVMFSTGTQQVGVGTDGDVRGIVSHRSITRLLLVLRQSGTSDSVVERTVELAMEEPGPVVDESDDVFVLFDELADSPYVLIDREDGYHVLRDVGFHQYLEGELEAFIIIEEIERSIREIFHDVYGEDLSERLTETFDSKEIRTPSSVRECSFAHYHVFVSSNWDRFEDYFDEDRAFVRGLLDKVGDVRNTLFHFRADPGEEVVEREYLMFAKDYLDRETSADERG